MHKVSLNKQLLTLNYSEDWLKTGVLRLDTLQKQLAAYENGEDLNTEHYRYVVFKAYIDQRESFKNEEVSSLLRLAIQDNDAVMAGSVVADLCRKNGLTDQQFDEVKEVLRSFGDWAIKVIDREVKRRGK